MIRDSNNEELLALEAKLHNITIERDSFQKSSQDLAKERVDLLDYIEDLNEKISTAAQQYEKETAKMHETIVNLQSEVSETRHELDAYVPSFPASCVETEGLGHKAGG